jgi:hypothetical protein
MTMSWGQNITINGAGMNFAPGAEPGLGLNDPNFAATYENATVSTISTIAGTLLGSLLISLIWNSSQTLVIAGPDQGVTVGAQTATFPSVGPANVTIWYDPHDWFNPTGWGWPASAAQLAVDPQGHLQYDDVLFHELVHCLRIMNGLSRPTQQVTSWTAPWLNPNMSPAIQWTEIEDFFAILMTNIYLSINGRDVDLRGGTPFPWVALATDPNTSLPVTDSAFYSWYSNTIDDIFPKTSALCSPASGYGCNWNPLTAYVTAQQQIRSSF